MDLIEFNEVDDVAETFMMETEIARDQTFFVASDLSRPKLQLEAKDTVLQLSGMGRIDLPSPKELAAAFNKRDLLEVARSRRSCNSFSGRPVGLSELAAICWLGAGCTDELKVAGRDVRLRTVPSAGARYPCNLHIVARAVTGLEDGVYYYHPLEHCVIKHGSEISQSEISRIFLAQKVATTSSLLLVISISLSRSRHKYGERGFRYALLEAGHIGQSIGLAAEYVGLAACGIGGYCDEMLREACGIERRLEKIAYPIGLGFKK